MLSENQTSEGIHYLFFDVLDISKAFIIRSEKILPYIQQVLGASFYDSLSYGKLFLLIWGGGILFILIKAYIDYIKEMQKLKKHTAIENSQVKRIAQETYFKNAVIMVSSSVDIPKVTGFLKARIYLPPLTLSDEELRLVLIHELQHVKNGGIFIKLFYILLTAILWWNPIIHLYSNRGRKLA